MSSLSTPLNNSLHSPQRNATNEPQNSTSPLKQPPQEPSNLNLRDQDFYAQTFKQLDHEAYATLITAVLITLLFWLAIFLTSDCGIKFLHMPLWFVLSCIGGYILSVVGVIVLVKYFLKDIPLHPTSHTTAEDQALAASTQTPSAAVNTAAANAQSLNPASTDSRH